MDGFFTTSTDTQPRPRPHPQPHPQIRPQAMPPRAPLAAGLTARLALTSRDLIEAYALRHDAYRANGYLADPKPHGLFFDEWDDQPSSRTILVFKEGRPAATVRVSLLDPASAEPGARTIPSSGLFGAELAALLAGMKADGGAGRAVEINRLARHPEFATDRDLVLALFRMTGYLSLHFEADIVAVSVRANHMPIYRRLGFQKVTEPRPYPTLTFDTGLMIHRGHYFAAAQRQFPLLEPVGRDDAAYGSFIGGEMVPVYPHPDAGGLETAPARHEPAMAH